jgi:hypothetical protein
MFPLDFMESYLMPVFIIFMTLVAIGVGALARKGGE